MGRSVPDGRPLIAGGRPLEAMFSELGVAIKRRSPAPMTLVVGYTDGALWYVPTRRAHEEGGYEVVDACRVAPGAGEQLVDRVLELLHELF